MTDQEIRIAVAEASGFHPHSQNGTRDIMFWTKGGTRYGETGPIYGLEAIPEDPECVGIGGCAEPALPDYCNDLNAMHEAEKTLNEKQQTWYLQKLTQVRFQAGVAGMVACMVDKTTFATAHQRAEAFLRVKGLWKE